MGTMAKIYSASFKNIPKMGNKLHRFLSQYVGPANWKSEEKKPQQMHKSKVWYDQNS